MKYWINKRWFGIVMTVLLSITPIWVIGEVIHYNCEQNSNMSEKFTSRGNIGVTSSAELLEKWREVIIDIDNEIIEGADKFFMQIL